MIGIGNTGTLTLWQMKGPQTPLAYKKEVTLHWWPAVIHLPDSITHLQFSVDLVEGDGGDVALDKMVFTNNCNHTSGQC